MPCQHPKVLTPFCPHCGANVSANPVVELRAYLARQMGGIERRAAKYDARSPEYAERVRVTARRWQQRIDALDGLIKATEETK